MQPIDKKNNKKTIFSRWSYTFGHDCNSGGNIKGFHEIVRKGGRTFIVDELVHKFSSLSK